MCRIGWAPNSIRIYIQQDETLHSLFISGKCSTCFGWYFHPSSGAHTTVSTASGICHTVTVIWRYRGRVGTGYATYSTLKTVPTDSAPATFSPLLKEIILVLISVGGTQCRSWLRHCFTSPTVAGSISDCFIGVFHWHNPSGRTMALGLTQSLTEMSTRNISWG
jgi:hypothetical protein